jgi:3-hydroxy-3-methylglutaryl CoA synthase
MMVGILAAGAYVPRMRLQRQAVVAAHAWFAPGLKSLGKGERAMGNWDEDPITMAVEAGRDCLGDLDRGRVARVVLASTSHPNADRQNAGIVKEALNLNDKVAALDVAGSQRAGTSALLDALYAAKGGAGDVLCLASERRRTQPASEMELLAGDAAAAFLIGSGPGAAEFVSGYSVTIDFVDHFRASDSEFDYNWESRWVRDEGYTKITSQAVKAALAEAGLTTGQISRFIMGAPMKTVNEAVAKACGIAPDKVADSLAAQLGDAGTAQPLILLAHALETAKAGDLLLVVGFGQGCDVLIFRATGERAVKGLGVSGWLARKKLETNYVRYLVLAGYLKLDTGMRAEFDQKTALTAQYRNRKAVLALVGGRCTKTGAIQFPKTEISVAQNDRVRGSQEDYPFAERRARIHTFTADHLTYTPDPPNWYGSIEFEEGGRMTVEFGDLEPEDIAVGAPMRMMFRIKAVDGLRGFTKYFWKAVPDYLAGKPKQAAAE